MKAIYFTAAFIALFYLVKRDVTFYAVLPYKNHTEVFRFVSTVENFQILNPTIINITNWEQTNETNFFVEYTENLSQLPAIRNYGQAQYQIEVDDDGSYELISYHSTCFFTDFLCISTESILKISQNSKFEVGYKELILYSCPWILIKFCFQEIAFQRRQIILKLKEIFTNVIE